MARGFDRKRRKPCRLCEALIKHVDYKDEKLLRRFVVERGKIVPRRVSGNCHKHQRQLTIAVKRARHLALLPFAAESYR